jgi:hypothetical protein
MVFELCKRTQIAYPRLVTIICQNSALLAFRKKEKSIILDKAELYGISAACKLLSIPAGID